jgi:hypothetical protein
MAATFGCCTRLGKKQQPGRTSRDLFVHGHAKLRAFFKARFGERNATICCKSPQFEQAVSVSLLRFRPRLANVWPLRRHLSLEDLMAEYSQMGMKYRQDWLLQRVK